MGENGRGAKSSVGADDRTLCLVPVAQRTLGTAEVAGGQHLEAWIDVALVHFLPLGVTLHVRLSKTNVDVEIGVHFPFRSEERRHQ